MQSCTLLQHRVKQYNRCHMAKHQEKLITGYTSLVKSLTQCAKSSESYSMK